MAKFGSNLGQIGKSNFHLPNPFSLQKSIFWGRKVKNIIQNIVSKINLGQIGQKLDQNGQKTLLCLNACPKLASHQNCILKVNSGQKMFQFYHIPRKSYQLDIFKGFQLVTVGPLCISYCHMKTASPMNTFDFFKTFFLKL